MRSLEKEGVIVTMLGSFNPSIFQPLWLSSLGLMPLKEAEDATVAIIQAQVADFKTDWFRMQVVQNRFQLFSLDATHYGPVRDLAAGIFGMLLHTPIERLGLTRYFHFKMDDIESWHKVGHTLAPKKIWNQLMETPGLRSMTIEGRRPESDGGRIFIKLEPSSTVLPGVFVEVSEDYFPGKEADQPTNARWVPSRLAKHWDPLMKYAENTVERLFIEMAKDNDLN